MIDLRRYEFLRNALKTYKGTGMNCWLERAENYALKNPDKIVITSKLNSLTYGQLISKSKGFAYYISKYVSKGDYVVCRATQTVEYFIAYCASLYCGTVFVPLESDCSSERLREIAASLDAKLVIGNSSDKCGCEFVNISEINSLCDNAKRLLPPFSAENNAQLLFTSGTTGIGKGIISANSSLLQCDSFGKYLKYDRDTRCYIFAPVNHIAFFMLSTAVISQGGEVVISQSITDIRDFVNALKSGVNAVHSTPSVFNFLLARGESLLAEYSDQIKCISFAGEKCTAGLQTRLKEVLKKSRLYVLYGSTETMHMTNHCFSENCVEENCVGVPSEGVEIVLLPYGEEYRIACKTPFAMKKYIDGRTVDSLIVTDDRGYIKDGKIYVTGRIGDILVSGGYKIDPYEVESAARSFTKVEDCVCYAINDKILGKVLKLAVRFKEEPDCDGLKNYMFGKLESYKIPRLIEATDCIVKTNSGKTDRKFYNWEN